MKYFFILITFLIFSFSYSAEYRVSSIGTEIFNNINWEYSTSIDEKGLVLGSFWDNQKNSGGMFFRDTHSGVILITTMADQVYGRLSPIALNNKGQILSNGDRDGGYGPFLWTKSFGLQTIDVFNSSYCQGTNLNDRGQIIGWYQRPDGSKRPFLWDNSIVTDMGIESDLSLQLESLGYYVLDITLLSINNKGEIAGYFTYGKFNSKKQAYVQAGFVPFFWNGEAHEIASENPLKYAPQMMKVNNNGVVMMQSNFTTYYWNIENGMKIISGFDAVDFNDSLVMIGYMKKFDVSGNWDSCPAIWKNGVITSLAELLGVEDIYNIAPPFSDNYEIEKITSINAINTKGQILCSGQLWGDDQPCIAGPSKP